MMISSITPIVATLPWWLLFLISLFTLFALWLSYWPGRQATIKTIRASPFSPDLVPKEIDTIVIGSGAGGCACSNLLAQAGRKVLVLEQHEERTGGCTHTFRIEDCEWDTGLHYTSEGMGLPTHRSGGLLRFMTRGKQEWKRLDDPYDQVFFPKDDDVAEGRPNFNNYEFNTGSESVIKSTIMRIDPGNKDLEKKCRVWMNLCDVVNDGFTALGISRVVPSMFHFFLQKRINKLYKLASYTVRDVQYAVFNLGYSIDQLLQSCPTAPEGPESDPVLRRVKGVLNHPIGDYAVQPRVATFAAQAITMAHYMEGASYTVGPTQNISIRSTAMVHAMGGEVLCDATVTDIIIENGRAVGVKVRNTSAGNDGPVTEVRAKNVVCATSVFNLYNNLLPKDLPAVQDFLDPTKRTIKESNGHVFLFCKIKGDAAELDLPKHNLWYFNGYDIDEAFDRYAHDPVNQRPPTVYIGFPCTKDPSWPKRMPGTSNCILISDGLWEWFSKWENTSVHHRGKEYEDFKYQLTKHLESILYEIVPQVQGKVEYMTLGTPLTEVTYLSSFHAGSYGTRMDTNVFDRLNDKWTTTPRTPIPGLYVAGSDAFLPAVCGAMYGGVLTAATMLGYMGSLRLVCAFLGEFASAFQEDNPKMSRPEAYYQAIKVFLTEKVAN
ncbi:FAD dependent oxidoreductase [Nitzschia inconspicua]|uniref:FAD dependent oxidoreductase n=1 Tax=Nitzschia inconspicua TaxID=303405 RepID=A0A9K3KPL2_9STRA|nr:FAD dependent oxidoreductase [Nitzschia inconspicua]KAG7347569.1 FAD dependent oxidoreductase [Nitzschia inconspicua]